MPSRDCRLRSVLFVANRSVVPMGSPNNIAVRAVVWLAALLIPAEALPMADCGCGGNCSKQSVATIACKPLDAASGCPCCRARLRSQHACCQARGVTAADHRAGCCGGRTTCCCCSKNAATKGQQCHCSQSHSVPAPVPAPGSSQPNGANSSNSSVAVAAVDLVGLPVVQSRAAESFSLSGLTSLERLSTLCRLVI